MTKATLSRVAIDEESWRIRSVYQQRRYSQGSKEVWQSRDFTMIVGGEAVLQTKGLGSRSAKKRCRIRGFITWHICGTLSGNIIGVRSHVYYGSWRNNGAAEVAATPQHMGSTWQLNHATLFRAGCDVRVKECCL